MGYRIYHSKYLSILSILTMHNIQCVSMCINVWNIRVWFSMISKGCILLKSISHNRRLQRILTSAPKCLASRPDGCWKTELQKHHVHEHGNFNPIILKDIKKNIMKIRLRSWDPAMCGDSFKLVQSLGLFPIPWSIIGSLLWFKQKLRSNSSFKHTKMLLNTCNIQVCKKTDVALWNYNNYCRFFEKKIGLQKKTSFELCDFEWILRPGHLNFFVKIPWNLICPSCCWNVQPTQSIGGEQNLCTLTCAFCSNW